MKPLIAVLLVFATFSPALSFAQSSVPLPPERAFPMQAFASTPGKVTLYWDIPSGYQIYQRRITLVGSAGVRVSKNIPLPKAEMSDDPFKGPTPVYRGTLVLDVPYVLRGHGGDPSITVEFQGCKVSVPRVCYMPRQIVIPVS